MRCAFFLGVAEAGFFPGIILYLTYWFPARERARIVSLFMAAVPLATMVGGPVSGALLEMHGLLGLKGWHWLFIVEGLPAVILGVIALKFLDDRPEHARWLSRNERTALASTLAAEAKATRETGYAGLGQALTRPRVLVLGFLYFCIVIGFYGVSFWMPQVIQTYGLTPLEIGFLTAIPFFFAAIAMVLWGAHSDRTGERIWHVALPLLVAGVAFAWSASTLPLWLMILALTLATAGTYAAIGTFWSLPTSILTGTGAAAGLALINSLGNSGGLGRAADHRRDQAGDRLLHRGAAVPRRRARARRGGGAAVRLCAAGAHRHASCHDPLGRVIQRPQALETARVLGYWIAGSSPSDMRKRMNDAPPPTTTRRTLLAGMALIAGARALPARAEQSQAMNVVLLGDSIFDNKAYVGDGPDVIKQLGAALPSGATATLAARDGSTTNDIAGQLAAMPKDATHLVVSVGGNNALQEKGLIEEKARSVAEVLDKLAKIKAAFRKSYAAMLDGVLARKLPTAICTIYEAHYPDPTTRAIAATGLSVFNDVISARGVLARAAGDRSQVDHQRRRRLRQRHRAFGRKAARRSRRAIATLVTTADFKQPRSVIYA